MFSYQTHSINLRTSGTRSLAIPRVNTTAYVSILRMEVNYGTSSPVPSGHYPRLQLSHRLFVIYNLTLTAVPSVVVCSCT